MKRNATAVWNGTGKEGNGHLTTQSGVLSKTNILISADLKMASVQTRKNFARPLMPVASP